MIDQPLIQLLLLLGASIGVVAVFQRLHAPPVLGYLLVGVLLGPYTPGPVIEGHQLRVLAEYGIVFLLFTIGLSFSLPQLQALRHAVLGLGTAQVVLTTAAVGVLAWLAGLPPAAAFVVGAVFAQSSTTIISRQLEEQREEHSRHGRLGLAMSVFQDVTAVPFVVVIPVLGQAADPWALADALGSAVVKAALAFALVYFIGRHLLRPFFHAIATRRSPELFTLTVLFVSLAAAAVTSSLGLSMAFGAFLVGMMLGETEFRHQIESAIRPFRDVLLGLFFIGIGMLFELSAVPEIWHLALLGALVLLVTKTLLVAPLVRAAGTDTTTAWRCGLLLAVGGEFGFALLAIALDAGVIGGPTQQVALMSVLLSMVIAPILIRYNHGIAAWLSARSSEGEPVGMGGLGANTPATLEGQVIICGYGRVGHTVATLLHASGVPFTAYDRNLARLALGRSDGHPVFYGDVSDAGLFTAAQGQRAALIVMTIDDPETALRAVSFLRHSCPGVPIIARARDLDQSARLLEAGATRAYPDAIEASLRLGAAAMEMVGATTDNVDRLIQDIRDEGYEPIREETAGD
jgi:monovalent cation:H+ antiporter-2, CPA2 family